MGRGYGEDFDRMSRIPGMRDFQVTYSKTYRWNLMDSTEDDYMYYYHQNNNYNNNHSQPTMSNRGMQRFPPPPLPLPPPPPPRRTMGPQPEYGPPGMILAPSRIGYDNYSWPPPPPTNYYYGPYGGGGGRGGYYDYQHPDDCRVM